MRHLFEKIKYSQFYKRHIKELKITEALRHVRDIFVRIKKKIDGRRNEKEKALDLVEELKRHLSLSPNPINASEDTVDVIIPIYNGYAYLTKLFQDLTKTKMNCRYILVDDQSPDERVRQLEKDFVAEHENAILLENDKNYGFVYSVNHGLSVSRGHVALVNTDTELPNQWLERLMAPIFADENVASTTPYTNSGTIFSFPNFCYNNNIYLGKDVETIDSYFRQVNPRYIEAPTGVGFCMGMNRKAIDEIGVLDYETFDRGFGEENDWCQRAFKHAYKNVQVENLFVFHKHGGSFLSDEKKKLVEQHMEKLRQKFPSYDGQVRRFIENDPNKTVRQLLQMVIDSHEKDSVLFFDHNMGGGATVYMDMQIQKMLGEGKCVFVVRYLTMENKFALNFYSGYDRIENRFTFVHFEDILRIGEYFVFDEIYINELVTYTELWTKQELIIKLKEQQNSTLIMLFHDYFAICPSINLLDKKTVFCEDATGASCEECYLRNEYHKAYPCETHAQWLANWKKFLLSCTEVRCFSEDTLTRVRKYYGEDLKLTLVPHQVNYIYPIHKDHKTTDTWNIGLLGVLAVHKGGEVVRRLLDTIQENNLNINICLIGWTDGINLSKYSHFKTTGKYTFEQLPRLVYENDIDIFLITSIWPETFSYTAEEIIKMGMPLATYDIGAPAERVRKYDKGMVLPRKATPDEVLQQIQHFLENAPCNKHPKVSHKRVLYVAEYLSFSSRYRLEHLKEELLYQGVQGDFYDIAKLPRKLDLNSYGAVVLYRCRYQRKIKTLVQNAKKLGLVVLYDIDDLIFDTAQMDVLPDFDQNVYGEFAEYSEKIQTCMRASDKIIVSTDNLKNAVKKTFGEDKPVYVNRNMASTEMYGISLKAREQKAVKRDKFVLGYFSGSGTHNEDFECISDVILEFMRKHDDVYLKIVGCLQLPKTFGDVTDRVIETEFLPWQDLPKEIASVDINLMPLQQSFFHHCKSENKWMEAAFVEVATIASYYEELASVTVSGENILLCIDKKEWVENLEKLYQDAELRKTIASNAFTYVTSHKTTLCKHAELLQFVEER